MCEGELACSSKLDSRHKKSMSERIDEKERGGGEGVARRRQEAGRQAGRQARMQAGTQSAADRRAATSGAAFESQVMKE